MTDLERMELALYRVIDSYHVVGEAKIALLSLAKELKNISDNINYNPVTLNDLWEERM